MVASFRIGPPGPRLPPRTQPLPGPVQMMSLTALNKPGQDMINFTTAVHRAPLVCSNIFYQHVTITSCTMASLSRGILGTDAHSLSTNSAGAEKEIKDITRKWLDLTLGSLMKV